jgi:hypothetical protein
MKKTAHLFLLIISTILATNCQAQNIDSTCFITLKNDEIVYADSIKLIQPRLKREYLMVDDKEYGLQEGKNYSNKNGYFRNFDSTLRSNIWYRLESKGKVNLYSKINRTYESMKTTSMVSAGYYNTPIYTDTKDFYTQIESQSPQKLSYPYLKELLKTNRKSISLLNQGLRITKAKKVFVILGTSLLIAGLIHTIKKSSEANLINGVKVSPIVYGGVIVLFPLLLNTPESKYLKAVQVFNGN